jgi:hypothetical protein
MAAPLFSTVCAAQMSLTRHSAARWNGACQVGEHEHAGDIVPGVRRSEPGDTLSKLRRASDHDVGPALDLRRRLRGHAWLPALRDGAGPHGGGAGQGRGLRPRFRLIIPPRPHRPPVNASNTRAFSPQVVVVSLVSRLRRRPGPDWRHPGGLGRPALVCNRPPVGLRGAPGGPPNGGRLLGGSRQPIDMA